MNSYDPDPDDLKSRHESIRKLFVSSLSSPTFLAQLMGYLPFSFDKRSNSLAFKFCSFPILAIIFHITFTLASILFYFIHLNDFAVTGQSGASATLMYTYLGSLFLATASACGIRLGCVTKHKEIISFYDNFKNTLTKILLYSNIDAKELVNWDRTTSKEMRPVRITTNIGLLFTLYTLIFISYIVYSSEETKAYGSFAWKSFGSFAIVFCSVLIVLYSALLIWLTRVVGLIRMGFRALEHSHDTTEKRRMKIPEIFRDFKIICYKCSEASQRGRDSHDSLQQFLHEFLELKELVKIFNSVFGIPMILSLAGLMCFWIFYGFLCLTVYGNLLLPFYAKLVSSSAALSMISLCFANFWSFCNASQKLYEQTNSCLLQLIKVDWDSYSQGSQLKIQMFYQDNLFHPTLISPGQYFNLSRKSLTSVVAVLLTYIIVLLQFKSSE